MCDESTCANWCLEPPFMHKKSPLQDSKIDVSYVYYPYAPFQKHSDIYIAHLPTKNSLIPQGYPTNISLGELAPCVCRLLGFIGPVPSTTLDVKHMKL